MAILKRLNDGMTHSHKDVRSIAWNEDRTFKEVVSNKPEIGCGLLIGSDVDYWLTTRVMEILEEREGYVRFNTENSEYELTTDDVVCGKTANLHESKDK